ncbi:MAG: helix-turn-helix domain-containing protein [Candidatus Odinarchaeota archaeon]
MKLDQLFKQCDTLNDFKVVSCLVDNGAATRGEIVKLASVKHTTALDSLERLYTKGIVRRETVRAGRGQPRVYWSLKQRRMLVNDRSG